MGVCPYPYLDIQAQQRRIPLPVKHPKSLQIPNSEQNKTKKTCRCHLIASHPPSPGLKGMSPNSYLPRKAKQMFPNAQILAACEVVAICSTTKERRAQDWVRACASVLRREETATGDVLLILKRLRQPLRCLSPSEPTRHTQRHRKKEKPNPEPREPRQPNRLFLG